MTHLRFLIDDVPACLTQRAVLADFAATLKAAAAQGGDAPTGEGGGAATARSPVEVLWTSALRGLPSWPDVPGESARRLAVRLVALAPLEDTVTVFLPAHTLPGPVDLPAALAWRPEPALASDGVTAVADLDLFAVDNASAQAAALRDHLQAHPGYEVASRQAAFAAGPLPAWLVGAGLVSARLFTRRPWYSAHAPRCGPWLEAVVRALEGGRLTVAGVAEDVQQGLVRPSLLEEVTSLRGEPLPAGGADLTLDALFVPPERRVPPAQRALLYSLALQRRTLAYARRNSAHKGLHRDARKGGRAARRARGPLALARSLLRPVRQALRLGVRALWRTGWRLLHAAYAASLRPLVHRLRASGGAEP